MAAKDKNKVLEAEKGHTATLHHARISAQKMRLVLGLVRGKQVEPALQVLQYSPKKGAKMVEKLLRSAIANAREVGGADVDKLWVTRCWCNEGRTMKRVMPRARGSADTIRKRSSHVTLVLGER